MNHTLTWERGYNDGVTYAKIRKSAWAAPEPYLPLDYLDGWHRGAMAMQEMMNRQQVPHE